MPVNSYGVLIGSLKEFRAENRNNQGKYRHGMFTIDVAGRDYTCAVDVDTRDGLVPVNWRVMELKNHQWLFATSAAEGWHPLLSNDSSGAVDYIRDYRLYDTVTIGEDDVDPFWRFRKRVWWKEILRKTLKLSTFEIEMSQRFEGLPSRHLDQSVVQNHQFLRARKFFVHSPWHVGSSEMALADLEAIIAGQTNSRMIFFGSGFRTGLGVHNIHQNQGNSPPSPNDPMFNEKMGHFQSNGIWQDGITMILRSDGVLLAFLNKFGVQSDVTDTSGNAV